VANHSSPDIVPAQEFVRSAGEVAPVHRPGEARVLVRRAHGVVRWVLGVPLLAKIVVLNTCLVALTAAVTLQLQRGPSPERAFITAVGAASLGALALNFGLVTLALEPVRALEETARRVIQGDYAARVPSSTVTDAELQAVSNALNALLDQLATDRERLRAFSSAIIGAGDRERARLGRDLNDHTAQLLSALVLQLSASWPDASAAQQRAFGDLRLLASAALEEVLLHARIQGTRVLDDLGLAAALQMLARESMARAPGLSISVDAAAIGRDLPPAVASALYFVAQEAVTNTVRHARAHRASLRTTVSDERVTLVITDDGIGFDVARAARGVGAHGVLAIHERVALLDGTTWVHSTPNEGTTVHVSLPIAVTRPA
jgi:two-component system, NarL family, sensor histidine kinase UhpB